MRQYATAPDKLGTVLDQRRTSRNFIPQSPPPEQAERILALARTMPDSAFAIVTAFDDFGPLGPGVYRIGADSIEQLHLSLPDESQVKHAAIGQPWARNFGAIVWLLPAASNARGAWIDAYVACGRMGQRIALTVCADPRIGVFQSPALVDDVLPGLLGDDASKDGAYMIGLGRIEPGVVVGPSEMARRFRPSEIFDVKPGTQ